MAGVTLAIGSTAFATRMISYSAYRPQFSVIANTLRFLASQQRTRSLMQSRVKGLIADHSAIDYTPVGAIKKSKGAAQEGLSLLAALEFRAYYRATGKHPPRCARFRAEGDRACIRDRKAREQMGGDHG